MTASTGKTLVFDALHKELIRSPPSREVEMQQRIASTAVDLGHLAEVKVHGTSGPLIVDTVRT